MDLQVNNLQSLICYKTQTTNHQYVHVYVGLNVCRKIVMFHLYPTLHLFAYPRLLIHIHINMCVFLSVLINIYLYTLPTKLGTLSGVMVSKLD